MQRFMDIRSTLWCLLPVIVTVVVEARLEAAAILPHGDSALDPTFFSSGSPERDAAEAIAAGSSAVGDWIGNVIDPDCIVLTTPHGIALTNDLGIYLGDTASGSAVIGQNDYQPDSGHYPYTIDLPTILLEPNTSSSLVEKLILANHTNVSGIYIPGDMPLNWGEVIPLLLIPSRQLQQQHDRSYKKIASQLRRRENEAIARLTAELRRHLIISFPLRRLTEAPDMVPELLAFGKWLRHYLDSEEFDNQKFGLVISGDLSHTHRADGPYGYSNTSALFDAAIGQWAADPCSSQGEQALLVTARNLQLQAKSCGFTGFVVLHGVLCCCTNTDTEDEFVNSAGNQWISNITVNRNATYFGMMAATFERAK